MSGETIKISVIVPIYNVENYVRPCIESIMGQSYRNLEIILVDDGSTDHCPEICDDHAKKDERIHVIHKNNGGVTSARKAGVAAATGDYVLNVDGDDWIEKNRIEILVRDGILPTHADMIHLSGITKEFGDKSIHQRFDVPHKLFENNEIENNVFPLLLREDKAFEYTITWSLVGWAIRRELLLGNQILVDDGVNFGDDFLCVVSCLLDAKSVMPIQQDGYHYIQRSSSITHRFVDDFDRNLLELKKTYRALRKILELKHASERIRKICNHGMMFNIMMYDYALLLKEFPDYLFPFPKVSRGARIVVYGAGRVGCRLVQYLNETKKCFISLWVDQNQDLPALSGYTVSPRSAISSVDYDFIVVAIMNAGIAREVKRSLMLDGIPEEKIATMDASVISEDVIPDEIKEI